MRHTLVPTWRLETHAVLASTNDRAIAAAEAGEPPGLAVLAHRQTSGRGRRGRTWHSLEGNLHLSVLLGGDRAFEGGTLALLAGVAMHDAVLDLVPPAVSLRLKYPNDLLADGAKLGGVLIEQGGPPRTAAWLVVGFGLNLATHPDPAGYRTVSLAALGARTPTVQRMAEAVLAALTRWLGVALTDGPAAVRTAWMARSFAPGAELSVATDRGVVSGFYRGLDASGALLLDVEGRVRPVVHGDVMVRG
jgi:BirA family biotin operon repressor/biotin-[acetyl-CoA-carboxylase] ligase